MREPEQIARAAIDDLLRAAGWQVCGGRGDRLEQLTYLLFLKMANERSRQQYNQPRSALSHTAETAS